MKAHTLQHKLSFGGCSRALLLHKRPDGRLEAINVKQLITESHIHLSGPALFCCFLTKTKKQKQQQMVLRFVYVFRLFCRQLVKWPFFFFLNSHTERILKLYICQR